MGGWEARGAKRREEGKGIWSEWYRHRGPFLLLRLGPESSGMSHPMNGMNGICDREETERQGGKFAFCARCRDFTFVGVRHISAARAVTAGSLVGLAATGERNC